MYLKTKQHARLCLFLHISLKALRETAKEEARFLYYTKVSLSERLTQTYIGRDIGYIDLRPSPHGKHNDQIRTNPTRTS